MKVNKYLFQGDHHGWVRGEFDSQKERGGNESNDSGEEQLLAPRDEPENQLKETI